MSIFDLAVGRCGCCEPPAPATPETVYNRPSLDEVAYRVGRFASFRQAMVQLVPDLAAQLAIEEGLAEPPLLRWTSRDSDDYGMALIEMWATIGDILTFYAERYANEAWLRTARDHDSIRRLAGLLGYRLKPGVAAGTHLAYRLDDGVTLAMRAGLRAQSVPGEGEVPQKFETATTLDALSGVNWVAVYGPPVTVTTLAAGNSAETLAPGTPIPAVGDPVILFTGGSTGIEERTVATIEEVDGRPVLRWSTPLKSTHGRAHPRGRAFRLFGHSAPATLVYATPQGSSGAQSVRWDTATTDYTVTGNELDLDGTVDGLEVGTEVLVVLAGVARRRTVEAIEHVTTVVQGTTGSASVDVMLGDATRITLSGSSLTADRRTTRVYELGLRIEPLGWEVPQTPILMGTTKLYVPYPEVQALADRRLLVLDDHSNDPMLVEVDGDAVPFTVGTVPEFLEVTLRSATTRDLDGVSANMLGNVVPATHGETVADEVIGDGDSSVALQEFTLAKSPVTHTSDPTAVGGARNSTEVIVDRVRWAERTGLYGAGASDRIYTTWIDDERKMHVRFGDGRFGARLPSGRANVVATYRQGLGGDGNVPAGRIITALDKPAGVASVSNPFPAAGGVDPESLEGATENAPNTVRTFDRAVSLRDFADLAREFAGVEKAFATWVWDGEERVVHVTVGGEDGVALSVDQLSALRSFMDQRRDPNRALRIAEFRPVPFSVSISVEADLDHFNEDVQSEVTAQVTDYFAYDNRDFGQAVHVSDVYEVAHRAAGVVSAHITRLRYKLRSDRVSHGVPFAVVLVHAPIRGATPQSDSQVVGAEIATLEDPSDLDVTVTGGLVR
jgi:hypothetical protein